MGSLSAVSGDTRILDSEVAAWALVHLPLVSKIITLITREKLVNTTMHCLPFNSQRATLLSIITI